MIWFCLAIPVVVILFLVFTQHKEIVWWEYLLQFLVPLLLIVVAKTVAVKSQTVDREYWNNYAVGAKYDEPWDEYIHDTCYKEKCSGSGKNRSCTSEPYDCSYVSNHSARWSLTYDGGHSASTSKATFQRAVKMWGNRTFKDMNRDYHSRDGDRYVSKWPGNKNRSEILPVTTTHLYENRVQAPNEVLNYDLVDTTDVKEFGLYDYSWDYSENAFNPIMGGGSPKATDTMRVANATRGRLKQLQMLILIFDGKPSMSGVMQEAHWKGGNKNEFVVCVGKKGKDITWVHVFSWTTNEILKVSIRDQIMSMESYDLISIANLVATEVPKKFVRRQFKEFSYIKVYPSTTAVIITFVLTLVVSIALALFNVFNGFTLGGRKRF